MVKTKETPKKESKKDEKVVEKGKVYETKYYKLSNGAEVDNPPEL